MLSLRREAYSILSEEAVEFDELDIFLRRNDSWDPEIDELRPPPPVKPIGVPGAASPSQMGKPEHKRYFTPSPQPSPLKGKAGERSASNALKPSDPGYQSVVDELHRRNEQEFDARTCAWVRMTHLPALAGRMWWERENATFEVGECWA